MEVAVLDDEKLNESGAAGWATGWATGAGDPKAKRLVWFDGFKAPLPNPVSAALDGATVS